jgi:hypothetical protein
MDPLMTFWVFCIGCFFGIILGIILSYRTAVKPLQHKISRLMSQDEQFREQMKYYPYDLDRFKRVDEPVDGIQFEEDAIIFVRLTEGHIPRTIEQERVKGLLEAGNVRWFEFPIK